MLTPTLALTSFAGTTPKHWSVEYWDENLLHGRPPFAPMPEVVGISVHLTFARRAFELARWYRERGSKVILGGLHVVSSPEECAPHADALAIGDGVQLWPGILADIELGKLQPAYRVMYENEYRTDPAPRRKLLKRQSFLTTTSLIATRGCHNRCGFCYLSTEGLRMPYRGARLSSRSSPNLPRPISPTPFSSITISGRARNTCGPYVAPCDPWKRSGAPRSPST